MIKKLAIRVKKYFFEGGHELDSGNAWAKFFLGNGNSSILPLNCITQKIGHI